MGMAHATVHSTNRDYEYVETKHRDSVWFAYSDSNAHAEHQGQWSKVNGGLWTRAGGRTRIRRGRGRGRTSEQVSSSLPFTICHGLSPADDLAGLRWKFHVKLKFVSEGGRFLPLPLQCHFWVFQNNDSKGGKKLVHQKRQGRKVDGFMLCWKIRPQMGALTRWFSFPL